MNKTTNYQLNQWERTDKVQMEDFNADNAKIDAAIRAEADARAAGDAALSARADGLSASKAESSKLTSEVARLEQAIGAKVEIVTGTYTGDGAAAQHIRLGRKPKAVYVCEENGATTDDYFCRGGLALQGVPMKYINCNALSLTSTGFTVYFDRISNSSAVMTNSNNTNYHYIAFI